MFGYVKPLKGELKIKEFEIYRGYYCGLCKQIQHEYSAFSRLFLSYDVSFLYLFLSALNGCEESSSNERCVANPFVKKKIISTELGEFCAATNVLLSYAKLNDNLRDDKNILAAFLKVFIFGAFNKARKRHPDLAEAIKKGMDDITRIEKEKMADVDAPANAFAEMMVKLIECCPLPADKCETAKAFAFNLGRYIYLIDALDDLEKDAKKKSYNPFLLKYGYAGEAINEFKMRIKDEASFSLYYSLACAAKECEKMQISKNNDIIDNIVYLGLNAKTKEVLEES